MACPYYTSPVRRQKPGPDNITWYAALVVKQLYTRATTFRILISIIDRVVGW